MIRDTIFGVLASIAILDIIICLALFEKQFVANLLRPIIVVLMYRSQQDFFTLVAFNLKDSFAMLLVLMIWVLYFAAIGNYLFRELFEGYSQFNSLSASYWAMFVCLTTENFPDVMLLAQEVSPWYTLFFIVFILIGCFYLMSVLLAVIFDNFKRRMEIL